MGAPEPDGKREPCANPAQLGLVCGHRGKWPPGAKRPGLAAPLLVCGHRGKWPPRAKRAGLAAHLAARWRRVLVSLSTWAGAERSPPNTARAQEATGVNWGGLSWWLPHPRAWRAAPSPWLPHRSWPPPPPGHGGWGGPSRCSPLGGLVWGLAFFSGLGGPASVCPGRAPGYCLLLAPAALPVGRIASGGCPAGIFSSRYSASRISPSFLGLDCARGVTVCHITALFVRGRRT
jgi:hypothetical protein